MVCIVTILTVFGKQVQPRRHEHELMELREECTIEIKITSIVQWRPLIAPPDLLIIDDIWLIRGIDGDDLFPRQVAFPLVEFPLVAEHETPALAFFWAEGRRRYAVFFPIENRRYLIQYAYLFIRYEKFFTGNAAHFGLDYFLARWDEHNKIIKKKEEIIKQVFLLILTQLTEFNET